MADAVIAVSQGTQDDVLASSTSPPERVTSSTTGSTPTSTAAPEATDALERLRDRLRGAVRPLRRPDHAPEGHHPPGARDPPPARRDRGRALRRRARHAGDRRRDGGGRATRRGRSTERPLDRGDGRQADGAAALLARERCSACPSVYEPFGIINLEAMACETRGRRERRRRHPRGRRRRRDRPAGAVRARGRRRRSSPATRTRFERDLAARINELMADEPRRRRDGRGRATASRRALRLGVDRAQDGRPVRVAREPLSRSLATDIHRAVLSTETRSTNRPRVFRWRMSRPNSARRAAI